MCQKTPTILNVQTEIGFVKNRENGIIEQAVQQSEISELLISYARKADFRLTYDLGYRKILSTFLDNENILTDNIITAISVAIDSQSYNLKTILDTLDIDYNPINNINIGEQIITATTINANQLFDKVSTSKNISEISKNINDTINNGKQKETITETITDEKGAYSESNTETQNLGIIERAITKLTTNGAQVNSNTNTQTHAPYNTETYSARDKTSISENLGERIDQENVTDQTNPITNTIKDDKSITTHTDTITKNNTINKDSVNDTKESNITQNPYTEENETLERNDKQDENRNENKDRTLKGLQGKSAQELILIQRQLANIDVVRWLCEITVNTIGNGFIRAW